jgi:hypothetical protein
MTSAKSSTSKSEASEDGSDDDDDETERNRQAARQRRKQEAHLAVYRQQMMKVTGSNLQNGQWLVKTDSILTEAATARQSCRVACRPSIWALTNLRIVEGLVTTRMKMCLWESLQRTAFPENRPPTRLNNANPNLNLRASSQSVPPHPGSVAGESSTGGARNSLPIRQEPAT